MRRILFLPVLLAAVTSPAQILPSAEPAADPPQRAWNASWVTHPTAPLRDPLVLHFRKDLLLQAVPARYPVRVSSDNRFILWVNGTRVGDGPARGDLGHWRYERFDLAPFLKPGENLITATVWNFGVLAPVAQISDRTAFLLESEATGADGISTPAGWLVEQEPGQKPLDRATVKMHEYMAAGPGEQIDAAGYDWDWQQPTTHGGSWVKVGDPMRESVFPGTNHAHGALETGDNPWALVEDRLPHMEYTETSPGEVVRWVAPGGSDLGVPVQQQGAPFTFHPSSHYHVLLDRRTLTTAYPRLTVSGGEGSRIVLTYAEALYDKQLKKGDRDALFYTDAAGAKQPRLALGLTDTFLPDGGQHRSFETLWWRTWRYLDLDITTGAEPLTLDSIAAHFTAYPFQQRASLYSGDADLSKIWDISWRTARLDAHETYMDTPYWEQLQYAGDTRIQALISYAVAGDDRLGRQAIEAFDDSRIPAGITRSRYPSSLPQNIPTFSLLWIGMVHDYWMFRPDPAPARAALEGTRTVLHWFAGHERRDGLLERLPWWSFVDWVSSGEIPTYSASGESCVTSLEYLGALDDAADLEQNLGDPAISAQERVRAGRLRKALYDGCWNQERGLLADNPDQKVFSQQGNVLGVLYDVIPAAHQRQVLQKMLAIEPGTAPDGILSASYYFRFYLARALDHAGMADDYLASLGPWRKLLPLHFSTWPEVPGDTRSDSHAWSSHPIFDLLTLVAGIQPESPGFSRVKIAPHLGTLDHLAATFPHPQGDIQVRYRRIGAAGGAGGLKAEITLPAGLEGDFAWAGQTRPLHPGVNTIELPAR